MFAFVASSVSLLNALSEIDASSPSASLIVAYVADLNFDILFLVLLCVLFSTSTKFACRESLASPKIISRREANVNGIMITRDFINPLESMLSQPFTKLIMRKSLMRSNRLHICIRIPRMCAIERNVNSLL